MRRFLTAFLAAASAFAADATKVDLTVRGIPATATEVVVVFDAGSAPPAGYDEPAAPVAPPPPAAAAAAPDPAAAAVPPAQPQRRRRALAGGGSSLPPPTRATLTSAGAKSASLSVSVPAGENYQARVVALAGDSTFPTVLAGGRVSALKLAANGTLPVEVTLTQPALKLASATPTTVAPGARFTVAGTLTDAAHALGTKNRMRVWLSEDTPPKTNFAGRQTSTIEVTTDGDDVVFSFELTAPNRPTTLYFQIGELPPDFARTDGKQAAFVVSPDLNAGARPLEISVK